MTLPADELRLVTAVAEGKKLSSGAMGRLADAFKRIEAERLAADKVAAQLKVNEVLVKKALVDSMRAANISAIGGALYSVTLRSNDKPTVTDWKKFYAYIKKNGAFELLERRVSSSAVEERWQDVKEVPGVGKFPVDKLSFTKLKG
jgi:hypothetical protein